MFVATSSFHRWAWVLAFIATLGVLFSAACSSDGSEDTATTDPGPSTSEDSAADPDNAGGMLPIGTAWEATPLGRFEGNGNVSGMAEAGGYIWVLGSEFNQPVVWRSTDGVTWTETRLPAREDGQVALVDVVAAPAGRLILAGNHGTRCGAYDAPEGYQYFDRCQRQRPVVYVSDDNGES